MCSESLVDVLKRLDPKETHKFHTELGDHAEGRIRSFTDDSVTFGRAPNGQSRVMRFKDIYMITWRGVVEWDLFGKL